ncbi:MAG: phosphoglycerate mutase [Candidatus Zambryskibacteria bacterium CG10_big_fil_rev_8_21_14_0_10_42_12]|uniref:Phosphoglycerate mutase n=1 Tax=Candidatus Zambryskibacteria bacterium CG10_big_fil_rev_8_21_14_0_10_42_12 TaxID=1975115 RepID=A0A2H0QXF3_9BACT|nr:MAG: phosphoglycerate mutase [Candidatus Zambryskibacteria bacterium CG10_big_fil_rev_8_21_14_0_10_42_12]
MLKIYITRHGQDTDNLAGLLNGHRDNPLTPGGIEQAHGIADKIKDAEVQFDAIYTSPLQRALETAKIISEKTNSPAPKKEGLLIERNFGIMTGKNISDIEKLCAPDILKAQVITYFLDPDGAETFPDLIARAKLLLDKIYTKHRSGDILLVTHGDIGKMIYAQYYNIDWEQILTEFNFGNCDLLLLSENSPANESHVFQILQHNH